jgi:transposase
LIGLGLAKLVFQVQGFDIHGKMVVTKLLRLDAVLAVLANLPVCMVGMEACSCSHFRTREIARLD